jgi:hypothetical protein
VFAVGAVVLALSACGGGDDDSSSGSSTTAITGTTTTTTVVVAERLLTPADLGSGWRVVQQGPSDVSGAALSPCGRTTKAQRARLAALEQQFEQAHVVLRNDTDPDAVGPLKVVEELAVGEPAREGFDLLRSALDECVGRTWLEGGSPVSMEAAGAPDAGDEAAAYVATTIEAAVGSGPELTWHGPLAVVRAGDALVMLHLVDVQPTGSAPRVSEAEWQDIITTAVAKAQTA